MADAVGGLPGKHSTSRRGESRSKLCGVAVQWQSLWDHNVHVLQLEKAQAEHGPISTAKNAGQLTNDAELLRVRMLRQQSELENRQRTAYIDRQPTRAEASGVPQVWPVSGIPLSTFGPSIDIKYGDSYLSKRRSSCQNQWCRSLRPFMAEHTTIT